MSKPSRTRVAARHLTKMGAHPRGTATESRSAYPQMSAYRLSPPYTNFEEYVYEGVGVEYVVISNIGWETLVFPADASGNVPRKLEIWGRRESMSDVAVLEAMGYRLR